jgi:hypothetical protein
MTEEPSVKMKTVLRLARWIFAGLCAAISLSGGIGFAAQQAAWASAPGESIWPLPGLVLLEWAAFGVIGFMGILLAENPHNRSWLSAPWFVIGAFLPLVILGALSIGPFVFLSLVALLIAALLTSWQLKASLLPRLKFLLIGTVANLGLLLGVILFVQSGF